MSEKFDRSKFKATQVSAAKQADAEVESIVRKKDFVSADYIDLKKLGSGTYRFRIYPPHPADGGDQYAVAKAVHWLIVDSQEFKDGKPVFEKDGKTPVLKRGPRPIFNSKIHGGTPKDIIEEYIAFAEKLAKDNHPNDEAKQKSFLEPIYGGFSSKFDGIMVRLSWVMYVDHIKDNGSKIFGRFEIGKAIKQRLNSIAASEGANDPLGTDPFTDPEEGRAVLVTYDSKATKSQDYYITELDNSFDKVTKMINFYPLSDSDLEKFTKYPSLHSMFKNAYKSRDFDRAINGLKIFDDEHKIGVFQYEAFLDIAQEISAYYPEEEDKNEKEIKGQFTQEDKATLAAKTEVVKHSTDRKADVFDDMDRDELKEFNRDNRTGIIIANKMSDDEVRNKLREWHAASMIGANTQSAPVEKEVATITDDLPFKVEEPVNAGRPVGKTTGSASDKVAEIRKKLAKTK